VAPEGTVRRPAEDAEAEESLVVGARNGEGREGLEGPALPDDAERLEEPEEPQPNDPTVLPDDQA